MLVEIELKSVKDDQPINYDVTQLIKVKKTIYNYQKLNTEFLAQEESLISFLVANQIDKERILGVFIRLIKNYSHKYQIDKNSFTKLNQRNYLDVFAHKKEVK